MHFREGQFLFRIPGSKTMFDFCELERKHLPGGKVVDVIDKHGNNFWAVETMQVSAVIEKFG